MPAWYMRDDLPQHSFRLLLRVPYSEKNMAKQAGAKWDRMTKHWYIDNPLLQQKVKRWLHREKPAVKQEGSAGTHGAATKSPRDW